MANTIKIKNSGTANSTPSANSLVHGELAINYRDGKIFFKDHLDNISYFEAGQAASPSGPSDSDVLLWMSI